MISKDIVYAGLAEIFSDVFMRDDIVLSDELKAKDVDGWDSFKQIEILMATEARFAMKFTSAEIDGFKQLGDLAEVVSLRGRES